jgi:glycine cleavage system protein P-like pyridoxal-binding family
MMIKKRSIHNVTLPFHSENMGCTFVEAAESQQQAEVKRLRRAVEKARREVKERDEVIEGQRKEIREMAKRGEMVKKGGDMGTRYGGSGSSVQKVERVKRAGRMMELLTRMGARGREAYDPL